MYVCDHGRQLFIKRVHYVNAQINNTALWSWNNRLTIQLTSCITGNTWPCLQSVFSTEPLCQIIFYTDSVLITNIVLFVLHFLLPRQNW